MPGWLNKSMQESDYKTVPNLLQRGGQCKVDAAAHRLRPPCCFVLTLRAPPSPKAPPQHRVDLVQDLGIGRGAQEEAPEGRLERRHENMDNRLPYGQLRLQATRKQVCVPASASVCVCVLQCVYILSKRNQRWVGVNSPGTGGWTAGVEHVRRRQLNSELRFGCFHAAFRCKQRNETRRFIHGCLQSESFRWDDCGARERERESEREK